MMPVEYWDLRDLLLDPSSFNEGHRMRECLDFPRLNILYNGIPKNASSTMKRSLLRSETGRDQDGNPHVATRRFRVLRRYYEKRPNRVLVLRDPVARAFSGYWDKIVSAVDGFAWEAVLQALGELNIDRDPKLGLTFREWVEFLSRTPDYLLDPHFGSQVNSMLFRSYDSLYIMSEDPPLDCFLQTFGVSFDPLSDHHTEFDDGGGDYSQFGPRITLSGQWRVWKATRAAPPLEWFANGELHESLCRRFADDLHVLARARAGVLGGRDWLALTAADETQ